MLHGHDDVRTHPVSVVTPVSTHGDAIVLGEAAAVEAGRGGGEFVDRDGGEAGAAHALATGQQNHHRFAEQVDVGGEGALAAEVGDDV